MSDPFGEARGLLAEGPEAWAGLRHKVYRWWATRSLPEGLVSYCAEALAQWPEDVVREPHPSWTKPMYEGRVPEPLALCNRLELCAQEFGDAHLEALANSPYVAGLRSLSVARGSFGEAGAGALARSSYLFELRELHLSSEALGARGARALAPLVGRLDALSLESCGLDRDGVQALLVRPTMLSSLSFRHNPLADAGARALLTSSNVPRLRRVDLLSCSLSTLDGLANAALADTLEHLDLGENPRLRDISSLCAASLPALRSLTLRAAGLSRDGWRLLRDAPILGQLEALDLGDNDREDVMPVVLGCGPALASLSLQGCRLSALPDLYRLALQEAPLRWLRLSRNELGDGLPILASARFLATLEVLELHACGLYDALGLERTLKRAVGLQALVVSCNALGDPGAREVGAWVERALPKRVDISDNGVGEVTSEWLEAVGEEHGCIVRV